MAKLEAETVECRAIINVYFNKPVGIGEHPKQKKQKQPLC